MKRFYILLFLLVGLCYYFLWRNNQVFAYRNQLFVQRLWMDYDIHQEYIDSIEHRYTYMEMVLLVHRRGNPEISVKLSG